MGYYTSYSLQCYGSDDKIEAFQNELVESTKHNGEYDDEVKELVEDGCVYAKLYDIVDWITKVAFNHPEVLVCLFGDGEDSDDMWEERWKGKEHEFQKSIIPPFENKNLQIPNIK